MASEILLYVWPGAWDLPSVDPTCLSAIICLQVTIPGQFKVIQSVNPDVSPAGQFPLLKHGDKTFTLLPIIMEYVSTFQNGHESRLDASLNAFQRSQQTAWLAHAESNLGDLVAHMLYSLHANWTELTHPTIVHEYPFPARYYGPRRIRESFQPRLESAGLWALPGIEQEKTESKFKREDKKEEVKPRDRFLRVFEREKVLDKAQSILDIYARLLGNSAFFQNDQLTTLDVVVAAHVLLLVYPPFPDPILQNLLKSSYPSLVSHAERVFQHVKDAPISTRRASKTESLSSLLPNMYTDDVWVIRLRWAYFGLTLGGIVAYTASKIYRRP
ncbi:hypothetical protein K435DRAFT_762703 [Dendrothele bispora CBS 962.96]|uniref:Mitochondrial outer membrane transport complex Sam37/metaxin N-terminal domain-containing protein n=1 Tax=Dendrothele bispora (strain CBS 962.96) TaxID=1314807 RepID=A0A4S8LE33_DENBC|nr:hypothetical protein K435DRAFT_762703 [Dendrothele bispora CBS 962.96]